MVEAQALDEQGRYKEAIAIMDEVITRDETFEGAYVNRGAYKSALGNYKSAISDYLIALSLKPRNPMALLNIGNNYDRLKKYDLALEYYKKAFDNKGGEHALIDIEFDPISDVSRAEIHYMRGVTYMNMDSLRLAHEDFRVSLNYNYNVPECFYWVGVIYLETGYDYKGCQFLKRAKNLGDKHAAELIEEYCK